MNVDLDEAKARLAELVNAAASGEDVVIQGDGASVRLVPVLKRRIAGLNAGNILYIADDFDDPLPDSFWFGDEETPRP